MPVLKNAKHERFAQEVAKGKSASEAYVAAGYGESRSAASRLSTNVNVSKRIKELQAKAAERTIVTIESLTEELEEARSLALQEGQASAAVSATLGKAKLHGIGSETTRLTGPNGGPIETKDLSARDIIADRIARITGRSDKG